MENLPTQLDSRFDAPKDLAQVETELEAMRQQLISDEAKIQKLADASEEAMSMQLLELGGVNLLHETLEKLENYGKTPDDVRWVGGFNTDDGSSDMIWFGWDHFASIANDYYDNYYGRIEVEVKLIVGDDWWLERREYDGSEWWEYQIFPGKPSEHEYKQIKSPFCESRIAENLIDKEIDEINVELAELRLKEAMTTDAYGEEEEHALLENINAQIMDLNVRLFELETSDYEDFCMKVKTWLGSGHEDGVETAAIVISERVKRYKNPEKRLRRTLERVYDGLCEYGYGWSRDRSNVMLQRYKELERMFTVGLRERGLSKTDDQES